MKNLTKVTLHGILAEQMPRAEWKLAVKSVGEAMNGIHANTKNFFHTLLENDKKNIKYRVLINDQDFVIEEGKDPNTKEGLLASELVIKRDGIKTIDIVPVLEGAGGSLGDIFSIVAGVILFSAGMGWIATPLLMGAGAGIQAALILGGLGLIVAGVTNLLTDMPKFGDFREIEGGGAKSYLFNGPENTIREGGPVFVGYGRLLVGSHVIQSASDTVDVDAEIKRPLVREGKTVWGDPDDGLLYNIPDSVNSDSWSS
tara:strand:+ start:822 stop:1592 length:771 start_codon:yes stop_codon:yes gene_type:complete